jgi:Kef-type K+ transport system membrane component KefB/glycine cleavage system regulatory protein
MDVGEVLVHILVVLVAAKVAAEVSERIGVPAVVGEIVAGIIVGPSLLDFVGQDEVLRVLGELGVILLLLEVGLEMDLRELGAVGRASMSVATVGVAIPFLAGIPVGLAFGMDGQEALFVGAALTATSVGITARVFGDLRALATVEARTVLGAAVADDVMGLVILTVVTRIVSEGSVSFLSLAWIIIVAVGFLVITTVAGVRLAPPLFGFVSRYSRSAGTLVAITLAFTLAFAALAEQAKLAPIVGAFVAGLALGRTGPSDRIRREIAPVSHLLVPVFFLQIGIDAEIDRFVDPKVLGLAAALLVVAVVGKLAAAAGLLGAPGDRLLVGIGMVPRGEVGLIFATIGLQQGVFGDDVYAALLLVVLVTTLATPPALRLRLLKLRERRQPGRVSASVAPAEGWLRDDDGTIELVSEPAPNLTLEVAFEAARRCTQARPGPSLLDWLSSIPPGPLRWSRAARERFLELVESGGPRSWRLLAISGVLERALPDLGASVARRQAEGDIDPLAALRLPRLARLQTDPRVAQLAHPERVLMAALVLEATEGDEGPSVVVARKLVQRLDLGAGPEQSVAGLVGDAGLLLGVSRRLDGLTEESVLQLAAHLGASEQARALYLLTTVADDLDEEDRRRLAVLEGLVQSALAHPELVGRQASNALEQRRAEATRLVAHHPDAIERLAVAPRAYVLATAAADLARQVALCDPLPRPSDVRVAVTPSGERPDLWWVEVVARDRSGLLARETAALTALGLDIIGAILAVWGDGCALASFLVQAREPSTEALVAALTHALAQPLDSVPANGVTLDFDDDASPWHTICTVKARDQRGLLHSLTTAFAAAGADVHSARVVTAGDAVADLFELTDAKGHKLTPATEERVRALLAAGVTERRRRFRSHAGPRSSVEVRPLGSAP